MGDPDDQLLSQLEEHEAGVADLIGAYELAERHYFDAVRASAPSIQRTIATNTARWIADANLG